MSEELLPCPFCEASLTMYATHWGDHYLKCNTPYCTYQSGCSHMEEDTIESNKDLVKVVRCRDCVSLREEYEKGHMNAVWILTGHSCDALTEMVGETIFIDNIETFFCAHGMLRKEKTDHGCEN